MYIWTYRQTYRHLNISVDKKTYYPFIYQPSE